MIEEPMPDLDETEAQATAVLKRARQHLQRGWCQGYEAVDETGFAALPNEPEAVRFCARGALWRATRELTPHAVSRSRIYAEAQARVYSVLPQSGCESIAYYNDKCIKTVRPLLKVFDRAIGGK